MVTKALLRQRLRQRSILKTNKTATAGTHLRECGKCAIVLAVLFNRLGEEQDMKVILLRDVAKVGRKNDVVEVPNGYGMNKLIPQGLAKPATEENVKAVNQQAATSEAVATASAEAFAALVAALDDVMVTIKAPANEEDRLFKAVSAEEVAAAIAEATGQPVTTEQIIMGDPMKSVGEHTVTLASGVDSRKVTITVEAA